MAESLLYLTELLGLRVYDLKGHVIGRVKEAALVPMVDSARIDRYLIGAGTTWLTIRHDQVQRISLKGIELADEQLVPYHSDEYMLRMVRDLLDQQIIDAHGRKVVRVTDVTFDTRDGRELYVTEVDIGLRSIFRRLMQGAPPSLIRWLQGPISPNSISWQFCNIIELDPMRRLRLNITGDQLEQMHPADLADIVEELSPDAREAVLTTIDSEAAAEALSEVDLDIQASILESLETEKAAEIIEEMSPAQAADVLQELEEETSDEILEEMESEPKSELEELMEHDEDTAGGMMRTEFISVPSGVLVSEALEAVKGSEILESQNGIVVVDQQERYLGVVTFGRLLTARMSELVEDVADKDARSIEARMDEERVMEDFDRYNLLMLPVVDERHRVLGVITADDVISVLRRER